MSSTIGKIKFSDGLILYGIFYTGCDGTMLRKLFQNRKDTWNDEYGFKVSFDDMPETINEHHTCDCGDDEDVVIATDYGNGLHWQGRACRKCMVITQNFVPFFCLETPPFCSCIEKDIWAATDGLPEWFYDNIIQE